DIQDRAASPIEEENLAVADEVQENGDDPCDRLCVFLSEMSKRKRQRCRETPDDDVAPSTKRSKEYWENDRKDERSMRQSAWRMFGVNENGRTARRPLEVCSTILGILRALVYIPDNENLMVNKNVAPSVKLVKILTQILTLGAECLDADQKPIPPDQRPKKWPPTDVEEVETPAAVQDTPVRLDDPLFFYDDLLRLCDDTLVILCHLASCLDFYDYPEPVVERLFSLLIRWTLFKTSGQSDLVGGVFSLPVLTTANLNEVSGAGVVGQSYFSTPPNRCALEVLCKLTVFERNVDLLLATPPRENIERFMRKLVALLAPGPALILGVPHNDPILREMALVIVASMCQASPEACRFFALETAMIERLATFLEQANSDMLRVAQTHSLQTLRDNPEIIGTSVGMLRRAAKALLCTSKSDLTAECKLKFKPHLSKFITITMSQLMDSRVGHTVAEILYELQQEAAVS
uniref:SWI/SNF-like complex subunit BAF250 C-terminal domain-containing protein n=1 Tax=Romanomermis culicivorax TaxID=13658 RepID=A0A915HPM6_ROMCU